MIKIHNSKTLFVRNFKQIMLHYNELLYLMNCISSWDSHVDAMKASCMKEINMNGPQERINIWIPHRSDNELITLVDNTCLIRINHNSILT